LPTIEKQLKFKGKLFYTEINENLKWNLNISESIKEKVTNHYSLRENDFLWICIGDKNDVVMNLIYFEIYLIKS
jgi:hypothetical protein